MVFTLPPSDYKIDAKGNKVPNYDLLEGKYFTKVGNERDEDREAIRFELLNISISHY